MILLDTNVVSEPLKKAPSWRVVQWLDAQAPETLFLSAITVAELRFGVSALPSGQQRDRLNERIERRLLPTFTGRVLPFDLPASRAYGDLMAAARAAGRSIPVSDGYIAAIAVANAMLVATRDIGPFRDAGLETINPWTSGE